MTLATGQPASQPIAPPGPLPDRPPMPPRYCGGMGRSPWELPAAILAGGRPIPDWVTAERPGWSATATYQCRTAVTLACRMLGIGPGAHVLAPSYHCGSEIDPLLKTGATVELYRITDKAAIDLPDLQRRLRPETKAVYVVHYFGWVHDLSDLSAWCRARSIALLEDCALSPLSHDSDGPPGRWADAAFFSLPKILPAPEGGVLLLPPGRQAPLPTQTPPWPTVLKRAASPFKNGVMRSADRPGFYPLLHSRLVSRRPKADPPQPGSLPQMPADYYLDPHTLPWRMNRLSRGLLALADVQRIISARRRNYTQLLEGLRGIPGAGLVPLMGQLPDGVCPLMMPLLVDNRRARVARLQARGIAAIPWWEGYHRQFDIAQFPDARRLKDHVLALPIHQDMNPEHIEYLVTVLHQSTDNEN